MILYQKYLELGNQNQFIPNDIQNKIFAGNYKYLLYLYNIQTKSQKEDTNVLNYTYQMMSIVKILCENFYSVFKS